MLQKEGGILKGHFFLRGGETEATKKLSLNEPFSIPEPVNSGQWPRVLRCPRRLGSATVGARQGSRGVGCSVAFTPGEAPKAPSQIRQSGPCGQGLASNLLLQVPRKGRWRKLRQGGGRALFIRSLSGLIRAHYPGPDPRNAGAGAGTGTAACRKGQRVQSLLVRASSVQGRAFPTVSARERATLTARSSEARSVPPSPAWGSRGTGEPPGRTAPPPAEGCRGQRSQSARWWVRRLILTTPQLQQNVGKSV